MVKVRAEKEKKEVLVTRSKTNSIFLQYIVINQQENDTGDHRSYGHVLTNLKRNFELGNEHYERLLVQFLYLRHSSTLADHLSRK